MTVQFNLEMWVLTVFLCGLGAAQHLDSKHENSIIEKGIIVSDEIQEYGLRNFNATCNNLLAAQQWWAYPIGEKIGPKGTNRRRKLRRVTPKGEYQAF